jgi:hypothetical protein
VVLDLMLLAVRLRVQEAIADTTFPICIGAGATMALNLHMSHPRCLALEIRRAGVAFELRSNMTRRDAMVLAGVVSGVMAGVEALATSAALVIHGDHCDFWIEIGARRGRNRRLLLDEGWEKDGNKEV